ncbi:hypothetical protein [Sulfobacillus sp. hq2]|nr:hypothetical protein [Sulfobacillus sp. hq2]
MAKIIIFPKQYQARELEMVIHIGQRTFRIREHSLLDRVWRNWKKHAPGA